MRQVWPLALMLCADRVPNNRAHFRRSAFTQTGSPDPRNDRICITSSCPRQLVLPRYRNGLSAICPIYPHRDRRTNIAGCLKRERTRAPQQTTYDRPHAQQHLVFNDENNWWSYGEIQDHHGGRSEDERRRQVRASCSRMASNASKTYQ